MRDIRDSLFQVTIGILGEMLFYHRLDAGSEFLLCKIKELSRWSIP
jgi:hypothetical protein